MTTWYGPDKPPPDVGANRWVKTEPGTDSFVVEPPEPLNPLFCYGPENSSIICTLCGAYVALRVPSGSIYEDGLELHEVWHKLSR